MDLRELEVLGAGAGRDVDDPGAGVERHVGPRDHAMLDLRAGLEVVERPAVAEADELAPRRPRLVGRIRLRRDRHPVARGQPPVLELGIDGGGHVGRERPRRRRPHHQRLARPLEQREAHVERGILALLVHARLRELVLRERRAAARAPLGGAVPAKQPAAVMHHAQEAPDVLDVGVAERVVVALPIHPHPEPLRRPAQLVRGPGDHLAAARGEALEPVLLDLALGVQAERLLHPDLDPQPLAVPPVLVALVAAAQRLIALEHVLERAPPRGVDAHHLVGSDRAVDEGERRAVRVLLAQALEHPVAVPPRQRLGLDAPVIRHGRQTSEPARHARGF